MVYGHAVLLVVIALVRFCLCRCAFLLHDLSYGLILGHLNKYRIESIDRSIVQSWFPQCKIGSIDKTLLNGSFGGMNSQLYRFKIYPTDQQMSKTVIVKLTNHVTHSAFFFDLLANLTGTEVMYYQTVAPLFYESTQYSNPRCYYSSYNWFLGIGLLVLQDINVKRSSDDLSKDKSVQLIAQSLATLHTRTTHIVGRQFASLSDSWSLALFYLLEHQIGRRVWSSKVQTLLDAELFLEIKDIMHFLLEEGGVDRLRQKQRQRQIVPSNYWTLIHGDVHPGNFIVSSDPKRSVIALDFQACRQGPAVKDLIGLALQVPKQWTVIMDAYIQASATNNSILDRLELIDQFRVQLLIEMAILIPLPALQFTEQQKHVYNQLVQSIVELCKQTNVLDIVHQLRHNHKSI